MKYRYLSAYTITGININQQANSDINLLDFENTKAFLTLDVNKYLYDLDLSLVIKTNILKRIFTPDQLESNFENKLHLEVEKIKKNRAEKFKSSTILVIEIQGEIKVDIKEPKKEYNNIIVCFDAFNKNHIRDKHKAEINAMKFAIINSYEEEIEFDLVTNGVIAYTNEKKISSYSFTVNSPKIMGSRRFDTKHVKAIKNLYANTVDQKAWSRIYQLVSQASNKQTSHFKSFLFAWTAIEVFINKSFKSYHKKLHNEMNKVQSSFFITNYFNRIDDVMKSRFTLTDKFNVIMYFLSNTDSSNKDLELFKRIKKIRDDLFHGNAIVENSLPVKETLYLIKKFMNAELKINNN